MSAIDLNGIAAGGLEGAGTPTSSQPTRAEVARTFEKHLLESLVSTLMEGILEEPVAGAGPLAGAGRTEQKQAWVSQLSEYLASQGGLGLSDRLLSQWEDRYGPAGADSAQEPGDELSQHIRP